MSTLSTLWQVTYPQVSTCLCYLLSLDVMYRGVLWLQPFKIRYPNEMSNNMVCVSLQLWAVYLSVRNLITEPWLEKPSVSTMYMENQMIAYFIYDLLILSSTARGRKQTIFFIHHIVSLLIAFSNRLSNSGTNFISNSFIVLLESTPPLLNFSKIMKEISPQQLYYLNFCAKYLFGFTRILCFIPWLLYYVIYQYQYQLNNNLMVGSCLVILMGSIKWFLDI
jgi:TLC domain